MEDELSEIFQETDMGFSETIKPTQDSQVPGVREWFSSQATIVRLPHSHEFVRIQSLPPLACRLLITEPAESTVPGPGHRPTMSWRLFKRGTFASSRRSPSY